MTVAAHVSSSGLDARIATPRCYTLEHTSIAGDQDTLHKPQTTRHALIQTAPLLRAQARFIHYNDTSHPTHLQPQQRSSRHMPRREHLLLAAAASHGSQWCHGAGPTPGERQERGQRSDDTPRTLRSPYVLCANASASSIGIPTRCVVHLS